MELKFIWIDNYTVIENLGVNFNHSDNHRFQYNDEMLSMLPNVKSPITFGDNITSVTVIAGENGSGKSSLCEAILFSVATYTNGAFGFNQRFKGIVCYGDHIFIYEQLRIKNVEELKEAGYEIVFFKESPFEEMKHEWRETFAKGGFIYYSNILDFRTDIDQQNLANISTLASLSKSFFYSTSYPKLPLFSEQVYENRDKDKHGPLQIHYNVEGNRIVRFYLNHHEIVPFINVRHFTIKCTYSGNNRWLDLDKIKPENEEGFYLHLGRIKEIQNDILNIIFDKAQKYDDKTRVTIDKAKFKQAIKYLYRYNCIVALSISNNNLPEREVVRQFVFSSNIEGYEELKADILELFKLHDLIIERSSVLDEDEFSPSSLDSYFEDVKDWRFYLIENYFLENNEENRLLLLRFADLEEKVLKRESLYRRITNFNVTPLSSGENSLLTFFSRIHNVVERYTSGVYDKNKLILFLDEAEIGFHPAWKRVYFNKLLHFLNNHFVDYKFQIIITTHSPYLLSDLPSQNIILLKRRNNEKAILVNPSEYKTFGANINELLATSFFLEEGLIGEFAQTKIQALIDNLQVEQPEEIAESMSKEQMNQMIDLIAEPFLQEKLREMFYQKFPEEFASKEAKKKRIIELEIELNRLRNG